MNEEMKGRWSLYGMKHMGIPKFQTGGDGHIF